MQLALIGFQFLEKWGASLVHHLLEGMGCLRNFVANFARNLAGMLHGPERPAGQRPKPCPRAPPGVVTRAFGLGPNSSQTHCFGVTMIAVAIDV